MSIDLLLPGTCSEWEPLMLSTSRYDKCHPDDNSLARIVIYNCGGFKTFFDPPPLMGWGLCPLSLNLGGLMEPNRRQQKCHETSEVVQKATWLTVTPTVGILNCIIRNSTILSPPSWNAHIDSPVLSPN